MSTRRGFLGAILAGAAAPAFVRAESLMGLWVPKAPKRSGILLAKQEVCYGTEVPGSMYTRGSRILFPADVMQQIELRLNDALLYGQLSTQHFKIEYR